MMSAIQKAQYYVYIENQFFITSSSTGNLSSTTSLDSSSAEEIKNKIGRALVDKVIEAHK